MRKLFVCGDTHCPIDMRKLNKDSWPEKKELTKDDILFVLGDFGLIWSLEISAEEAWWTKWFNDQPFTTIFLPGNHENYARLAQYSKTMMFGARCREISESIFMVEKGEVLRIEGKNILCFGGAESTDKAWRVEDVSWWSEETYSKIEENVLLDNMELFKYKFDHVFTHTCPTEVVKLLIRADRINDPVSKLLSHVAANIEYESWHFGHMHDDKSMGKFHCHYNNKPVRII